MITQFRKYKKFNEVFSWQFENKFAMVVSIIVLVFSMLFDMYNNFNDYIEVINNLSIALIGGYIGALALIFSGVVFWCSLFNKRFENKLISYTGDAEVVDKLYVSYIFLAFNILCMLVCSVVLLIAINSRNDIVEEIIFYIVEFIYIYWTFYIWGYLVALIKNAVDLIRVQTDIENGKTFYEKANEIRIDMIFEYLYMKDTEEQIKVDFRNYLKHYVELLECSEEEKGRFLTYFKQYYDL